MKIHRSLAYGDEPLEVTLARVRVASDVFLHVPLSEINTGAQRTNREIQMAAFILNLQHPNILKHHGTCVFFNCQAIVMEWCANGNIQRYLEQTHGYDDPDLHLLDALVSRLSPDLNFEEQSFLGSRCRSRAGIFTQLECSPRRAQASELASACHN